MQNDRRKESRRWSTPAGMLEGSLDQVLATVGTPNGCVWEPRPSNTEHGPITIFIPARDGVNLSGMYGSITPEQEKKEQ